MRKTIILAVVLMGLAAGCGGEAPDASGVTAGGGSAAAQGILADNWTEIPDVFGPAAPNSSDPDAKVFKNKLYVYTSSDRGYGKGGDGNIYPMNTTYVHSIDRGMDPSVPGNWTTAQVWTEDQYVQANWVTSGSNHLWAPAAFQMGKSYDLMVPDVEGNKINQSRIGVSTATSPAGPFSYLGRFDIAGYASDPSLASNPNPMGSTYLVWANGDWDSQGIACGGISIGQLDRSNPLKVLNQGEIRIEGIPYPTDRQCLDRYPAKAGFMAHPYLEGPSLYYFGGVNGSPTIAPGADKGDGVWYLVFVMHADGFAKIAYARSKDLKTWKYQGVIMDNNGNHELTNQASIVKWGNDWLMFYHDGPPGVTIDHNRRVKAECITFDPNNGRIMGMDYGIGAQTEPPLQRTTVGLQCARGWPGAAGLTINIQTRWPATVRKATSPVPVCTVGMPSTASGWDTGSCTWAVQPNSNVTLWGSCKSGGKPSVRWEGCDSTDYGECTVNVATGRLVTYTCD